MATRRTQSGVAAGPDSELLPVRYGRRARQMAIRPDLGAAASFTCQFSVSGAWPSDLMNSPANLLKRNGTYVP
jgi:hypothetical protein